MTNREWLAGMTDRELGKWLDEHIDACCICSHKQGHSCDIPDNGYDCENGRYEWLGMKHKRRIAMTRFDWIRNMTNEELVQFMRLVMISGCGICSYEKTCRKEGIEEDFCSLGVEQWLKQEAKLAK